MIRIKTTEIYEVSKEDFCLLIDKWNEDKNIPRKLYFTKINGEFYLGLDNEYGSCYLQEFDSKHRVLCWLIRNDYSASEINRLVDLDVRRLLSKQKYTIIQSSIEDIYGL